MALTGTMPAVEIPGITPTPYPFGLFSIAPAATPTDEHWQAGVWWNSTACQQAGVTNDPCNVDSAVPALDANVTCGIVTAETFTVYARSTLSVGGKSLAEKRDDARNVLIAGEQNAVESVLWARLLAATVTPSTAPATTVQEAIARLEGLMRDSYAGTPVFHLTPFAATMAADTNALRVDGTKLRTFLGSQAVAGGGYGDPVALMTDQSIIASGAIVIVRSEITDLGEHIDRQSNQLSAVVERTYTVGWDCTAIRIAL